MYGRVPVEVVLEKHEMEYAATVGVRRQVSATVRSSTPRFAYRTEQEKWGYHVVGAMAECAVAKAIGVYWPASYDTWRTVGDVGQFEVRWSNGFQHMGTTYPPMLKVRPDEPDAACCILVSGSAPKFIVQGWIRARDAKRPEWSRRPRRDGPPAFFVPMDELMSIETLMLAGMSHGGDT